MSFLTLQAGDVALPACARVVPHASSAGLIPPMLRVLSRGAVVAERHWTAASSQPPPLVLDAPTSRHAPPLARAMSSPTDVLVYSKRLQTTAAAAHVKL